MAGLRLVAGGDVALGGVLCHLSAAGLQQRLSACGELFAEADLGIVSLDCAIGTEGAPPNPDEYIVDAPTDNLQGLVALGVTMVSLANNHSTDRGAAALLAGRRSLSEFGIRAVGAGDNQHTAAAAEIVQAKGLRVGVLAFASSDPWVGALPATADAAGVAGLQTATVLDAVRALRPTVDAVIVCLHWGKEFIALPPPDSVAFARQLIDAGVCVVLGTHPHVMQPVEAYGRGVICYSLGNLLFPPYPGQGLRFDGAGLESLVVSIDIDGQGATVAGQTVVSFDDDGFVRPVSQQRSCQLLQGLEEARRLLGGPSHEQAWQRAVRQHELARLRRVFREEVVAAGWLGGSRRLLRLGRKNLVSVGRSLGEILWTGKAK